MDVSFLLVNFRSAGDCRRAVESIQSLGLEERGVAAEIAVVDNASGDDSLATLRPMDGILLIENDRNAGFGAACNLAIAATTGAIVWLVNPDAFFESDIVSPMLAAFRERPRLGAASPTLHFGDAAKTPQEAARDDPSPENYWRHYSMFSNWKRGGGSPRPEPSAQPEFLPADWLMGASLALRREALNALGEPPFDERFFLYFEDADLCRRLRVAGWEIGLLRGLSIGHLSQRSSGGAKRRTLVAFFESLLAYAAKWMSETERARLRRRIATDIRLRWLASWVRPKAEERRAAYREILGMLR
jgi:N-acetylglucosaminyl-diphospho-decaprenol L-rhamnosyltransferase